VGCYEEGGQASGSELDFPALVLGGILSGTAARTRQAGIIGADGIEGLTLRGLAVKRVRSARPQTGVLGIATDDQIVFIDVTDVPFVAVVLPDPAQIAGQELTLKRIDATAHTAIIEVLNGKLIDGNPNVALNTHLSGYTFIADASDYKIIGVF
jgi:hypothetical protein